MITLVKALQQVMDDESFKINTPAIINTRKSAESLMNWCLTTASLCSLKSFNKNITECLQQVILSLATKSLMYNKEKLWRQFYLDARQISYSNGLPFCLNVKYVCTCNINLTKIF